MRITGRRALVVGGAGGIGAAIADTFADAGATVLVADRRPPGRHPGITLDVTDEQSVADGVAEAVARLGGIDVLVNSAGVLDQAEVATMPTETWRRTIDVDLTGVFLVTRAVLPHMTAQRWGRIITIASQLGIKGSPSMAHYAAAKAGVIGFTKSLAQEVAGAGVLVNAIAPGPVETEMTADLTPDWRAGKTAELPLGRFGAAAEVAPTALLLASEPGGNLYVGQTLHPNSGDVMP
ncbi:SDR family oxidoreductase [Pseudonocardia sp. RS11V-5]|uniref:SDR family NAD(P)-dependent oxidoreductase n=1 Tax=Pseudonocardia terrae TaxID=2905831 RepID=UPI001E2950F6|nr:SDR family NAD(P)-dependent oxidoreductase [Pseudonocardia terrae]MCE3551507.1 SDR family oxidoreductase [Pseudonocardia terrae]